MIDVTSKAFMGMTVGCACCYDHKFDPIPTTDAMYGMFESFSVFAGFIDLTPQKQENINEIERLNEELLNTPGKQWEKDLLANQPIAQKVQLVNNEISAKKEISANYNLIADFRCETEVSLREKGWEAQGNFIHDGLKVNGEEIRLNPRKLRLEAYSVGKAEVLRSPNFIIEDDFYEFRAAGNRGTVRLIIDNFQLIQDPIYGDIQKTIYNPEMDFYRMNVKMWKGHKAYFEFIPGGFKQHVYEVNPDQFIEVEYIFSYSAENPSEKQIEIPPCGELNFNPSFETLKTSLQAWIKREATPLQNHQLNQLIEEGKLTLPKANAHRLLADIDSLKEKTYDKDYIIGMSDGPEVFSPVFIRGSINQLSKEKVPHQFLYALSSEEDHFPQQRSGRLAWVEKAVSTDNPLAARVMINRLWHHIFGRGIVETVDNFGLQGKLPTHPELLDYLAITFIEEGWSMKQMIRYMLLTNAFQRSTAAPEQNAKKDPNNDYLAHFRVKRMEGEAIRDAILAVSGCLDSTLFGPSVLYT
ncbi:MAG: DUF1553 domain-containing protein [Bacteroidia bacterium]